MQTYELRMESPVDSQFRTVILDAADESVAREAARERELKIVNFSLLPPERELWEMPRFQAPDDPDGVLVDLGRWDAYDPEWARAAAELSYEDAVSAAKHRLNDFTSRIDLDNAGKVRSRKLGRHTTARLLAHNQLEPYAPVEIRAVQPTEKAAALSSLDGMREFVAIAKRLRADNDPRWDPAGWSRIFDALRDMGAPLNVVTAAIHGAGVLAHDSGATPIVWGTGTGGDDIFYALLTAYTANPDSHDFWDDVVSTEIANGGGYITNGVELAGKAFAYDSATDQTRGDANDISITSSTLSATDAALYDRTPATNATRPVIGSIDFGTTVATTSGTFGNAWDAAGAVVRDYT